MTLHTLPNPVELAQLADLNGRLSNSRSPVITAAELGLAGPHKTSDSAPELTGPEQLVRVSWDGTDEEPVLHGYFRLQAEDDSAPAGLEPVALKEISRRLHLNHRWSL
ncbi:MAG TPA: hypothetical protein VIT20_06110 [Propionibacteriaceae bacterium]